MKCKVNLSYGTKLIVNAWPGYSKIGQYIFFFIYKNFISKIFYFQTSSVTKKKKKINSKTTDQKLLRWLRNWAQAGIYVCMKQRF